MKNHPDHLPLQSPDMVSENIERIAALFPNCVTEGLDGKVIDFDLLRQELSRDIIEGPKERYRLEWPGKRQAIVTANLPTTKTLRPIREDSVDFDTTQNLYIEGDNLEVLKLLQESYLGKVKMIYIDPPYNTGKDFVYRDNFTQNTDEYLEDSGQKDQLGNRLVVNPESNGRYHSDWLTMMFSRLKLAKNLLRKDGVIFISIDYHEEHNLRKLCDEIFGEKNFRGHIVRATGTTTGQEAEKIGSSYDSCLCYSVTPEFTLKGVPLHGKDLNRFNNDDNDGKGVYALLQLRKTGNADRKEDRESMFYPIQAPDGGIVYPIGPSDYLSRWRVGKNKYKKFKDSGLIVWKENVQDIDEDEEDFIDSMDMDEEENEPGLLTNSNIEKLKSKWKPYVKYYLENRTKKASNLWSDVDGNKKGSIELKNLFNKSKVFDNPKPTDFLRRLIRLSCDNNDLVLDFFAGSGSFGHSVILENVDKKSQIKFILIQVAQSVPQDSLAAKAGFQTISEMCLARIKRAAYLIRQETSANVDFGCRVYRLAESNMQDVYHRPQDLKQDQLDAFADNVKPDRTADDLLAQVMLAWGLQLSLPIERGTVAGKAVHRVAGNSLLACFDAGIDETFAKEVAKERPLRIIFRDSGFKDDTAKENVRQLLRQLSPETEMRVI
jgi:adenine-specific DNA-methyltransferase